MEKAYKCLKMAIFIKEIIQMDFQKDLDSINGRREPLTKDSLSKASKMAMEYGTKEANRSKYIKAIIY